MTAEGLQDSILIDPNSVIPMHSGRRFFRTLLLQHLPPSLSFVLTFQSKREKSALGHRRARQTEEVDPSQPSPADEECWNIV